MIGSWGTFRGGFLWVVSKLGLELTSLGLFSPGYGSPRKDPKVPNWYRHDDNHQQQQQLAPSVGPSGHLPGRGLGAKWCKLLLATKRGQFGQLLALKQCAIWLKASISIEVTAQVG